MSQLFTTHIAKQSLLNLPVAGDATSSAGYNRVTGLPPILVGEWASVTETVAVAETAQIITLGGTTPTINASTIYKLLVGNPNKQREGFNKRLTPIGYTSAATLSGDPAVDRQNVYRGLASAINRLESKGGLDMTAREVVDIPYTGQTSNFAVGEIVTGGTSGATGEILADADAGATGTITVAVNSFDTPFQASEALSTPGGGDGTSGTIVVGVALRITDNGGYYGPDPSEILGPSVVLATSGFTSADLATTAAGVISHGQGADLAQRTEALNSTDNNLTSPAEFGFPSGFVSGQTYSLFIIEVNKRLNVDAKTNSGGTKTLRYAVWADDAAAGFAAFRAALLAL